MGFFLSQLALFVAALVAALILEDTGIRKAPFPILDGEQGQPQMDKKSPAATRDRR